ncbi:uncharacterized protein LOC135156351 [Lytechinus pictus]|uniref:uncharacterized protein LOC135156351 n=1 Tax=Lytechinus pictus TaxID=7653 RepID=UPI0030B9EE30
MEQTGFRYFFKWINPMTNKRIALCVDATDEPDPKSKCQLGRLVNHSKGKEQNSKMTAKTVDGKPVLCLYAMKDIPAKSEILYDYGLPQGHNWNTPYYSQLIGRMQEDLQKHTDTPKVQVDGEQEQDKLKGMYI